MESLDNMLNIGKEMKRKLFSIGVRSMRSITVGKLTPITAIIEAASE